MDATALVQDMISLPDESFGFTIRLVDEADYYSSLIFASSYNVFDGRHPKLEITYKVQVGISGYAI